MATDQEFLQKMFDQKIGRIGKFATKNPEVWDAITCAFLSVNLIDDWIPTLPNLSEVEFHRYLMRKTVTDYLRESFFLILDTSLDAGIALLRMSAELARDIRVIGNDSQKLAIWLDRQKSATKRQYRDHFKFDESDCEEAYVYKLYKLASSLGVHGHTTDAFQRIIVGHLNHNGQDFAKLEVSAFAVLNTLNIWMCAFFPVNNLSLRQFLTDRSREIQDPGKLYFSMLHTFSKVVVAFGRMVKDNAKELRSIQY